MTLLLWLVRLSKFSKDAYESFTKAVVLIYGQSYVPLPWSAR
jgi:hypothetical protein